jgi:3-deoxy-manno-octulosonate cytidylyltransferase (CMP-KDO synthetase)
MDKKTIAIIPARYNSTRFPGKPLQDINGKSLIQRVYLQALKSNVSKVVVATDDERIFNHVFSFGGQAVMTSPNHLTGTDRCFEAYSYFADQNFDFLLNIQGDEPFIDPEQINQLINILLDENVQIATLVKKIEEKDEIFDPKEVKVVFNSENQVLYMSRSPIPHIHQVPDHQWIHHAEFYKHIGIYGFKTTIVNDIKNLEPSKLETCENLEQLRWIEKFTMKIAITTIDTLSIDTPHDLQEVYKYLKPEC